MCTLKLVVVRGQARDLESTSRKLCVGRNGFNSVGFPASLGRLHEAIQKNSSPSAHVIDRIILFFGQPLGEDTVEYLNFPVVKTVPFHEAGDPIEVLVRSLPSEPLISKAKAEPIDFRFRECCIMKDPHFLPATTTRG